MEKTWFWEINRRDVVERAHDGIHTHTHTLSNSFEWFHLGNGYRVVDARELNGAVDRGPCFLRSLRGIFVTKAMLKQEIRRNGMHTHTDPERECDSGVAVPDGGRILPVGGGGGGLRQNRRHHWTLRVSVLFRELYWFAHIIIKTRRVCRSFGGKKGS